MTLNKTQLALGIAAATLSMAMVAPVQAADNKAERVADAAARKAEALELQMQQMADQMAAMQAELSRVKSTSAQASTESAKVQELDHWMASMKSAPAVSTAKDNLVAVRGGWSKLDHARANTNSVLTDGGLLSNNTNADGYYFGGAFDFNVNNDLFGLMDDTSFMIEFGFEYAQYGTGANTLTNGTLTALTTNGGNQIALNGRNGTSTDARLRINASPKIKFMHGSKFRPWLIPVGLDVNILGVPSNAVSVLNAGMNFGAGAEYDLFRGVVIGADTRYHYMTSKIDGTPNNGFTAGGYVGFKF
ncbi:hypothetical protein [Methylomonas methanica]|uniref:Outer membrane protein beta-barrel domain-containing protein n=1 Tax=Methylomonas methanica (strain DSM 25384 / MC09) TaxID=857087 RepID=G0A517_METMM|nr:hypothetical protein [Methylomonas methanica]AEF99180.1 hypothetical protein Metme_0739 [Methylomonas methanica MC09]